jgi:ABC-type multidrug transport system ATPase subunit
MIDVDQAGVQANGVTLLAPVSVALAVGEVLLVRGGNGAGKSTLLGLLAGSRQPTSGRLRVGGAIVDARDRVFRRRVAAMIGLPPFAPDLTVADHVLLVASTWVDRDAASALAHDVLGELGLGSGGLAARYPHELSSGQTQLFGLALVLARPFELLIVDEPEQRLDPEHLAAVIRVLRACRDDGATIVVATHSDALADALGGSTIELAAAA